MNVEERGTGPPIVLVHGFGAGAATWRRQIDLLSDGFRVLAPDLPGFGASPAGRRADAETFAASLEELFERNDLEQIVLIGWSMGGVVVLAYCEHIGLRRLAGVGIVDVSPRARPARDWSVADFGAEVDRWIGRWDGDRAGVLRELAEMAFAEPERHAADVEWLVAEALRADPVAALAAFRSLLDCDFRDALERIDVPALLVFGGRSRSTSAAIAAYMERRLPHPRLVVLEDCGHAVMLEAPERFAAVVREFSRSVHDAP